MGKGDVDELMEEWEEMEGVYKDMGDGGVRVDLEEGGMGVVGKGEMVKNEIDEVMGQVGLLKR
ncbi:hypothetical protein [Bacillus velezensis]|uniref:hypothetical protein n=1 Tax=Bacillus velezensis TaxID=492670 RepID=UPI0011A62007|nr:hypothetical protein [Bacillus velezensis]